MNVLNKTSASLFTACLLIATPLYAFSDNGQVTTETALIDQGAHIAYNRQTGEVGFIGSNAGHPLTIPHTAAGQTPASAAMNALEAYGHLFGLNDPTKELSLMEQSDINANRSRFRYQQNYQGIPVIAGELNVNLGADNTLLSINGEIAPKLKLPTEAQTSGQQAKETAITAVAKWYPVTRYDLQASSPILSVYAPQLLRPGTDQARLVWRIEVRSKSLNPIRELVLIDAVSGGITEHFNQVDTAQDRETYTSNATSTLPGTLVCDEADPTCSAGTSAGDNDAVSAHLYAGDTYNFYSSKHGRDGIDDAGMTIISSVDWTDGSTCPNAFWNGSQMVYCDTLPLADDVVAHELTHGVTEHSSNLFYYYQSGAINESLSDTWGEFVDLSNGSGTDDSSVRWQMGEDATAIGGTIRDMSDPTLYSDPDKMSSSYYATGSSDNGGVHTNSGVNNKAVYLMVDGNTFNGTTVTGIGIDKVAKIYYEVQTNLLTSGSDYLDLYNALYQGCQNLVGTDGITSGDCDQVRAATNAVEMNQEPSAGFNPEAAICPTGTIQTTPVTFSDDIESGLSNWTFSDGGYGQNWEAWGSTYGSTYGPYATSGVESIFAEDIASVSDQRAVINVTVPSGRPYLHFKHAFDFESGISDYDGGVLEYRTSFFSPWTDASALIDAGQGYNDTISTCCSNPLAGLNAFSGSSHGYVSTRLDLSTLAGKNIKFRWRAGTDSSVSSLGWWLDDVQVYDCDSNGKISFSSSSYKAKENDGSITITVSRDGLTTGAVSIDYATSDGTATSGNDYSATSGTLNWADGDNSDKTFTVTLLDDYSYEGNETVHLTLSNPTGGATLGDNPSGKLTIKENDPIPLPPSSGSSGGGGGALGWPFLLLVLLWRAVPSIFSMRGRTD